VKKLGNLLACKKEREANETNIVMKASAVKNFCLYGILMVKKVSVNGTWLFKGMIVT
jgi:hypothetical protein